MTTVVVNKGSGISGCWLGLLCGVGLLFAGLAAAASNEHGRRDLQVNLVDRNGEPTEIGTLTLQRKEPGFRYHLELHDRLFIDQFLSMRPFRCLGGDEQMWCRLVYPYELKREISVQNLTDLEYDLLFIRKHATRFGADFWDGVYYKLRWLEDGTIEGVLRAADMNLLASPPEQPDERLISEHDLHEVELDNYRFPKILIHR